MTAETKFLLAPKTLETADATARPLLEKAKAQSGFIPNMYAGMANSPGLLQTYLEGYTRFREQSGFNPVEQEVVFLVISHANGCGYCTAAHSMIAEKMSKVPADVLAALRSDALPADPKLAALATFVKVMFSTRGQPGAAASRAFADAGYGERQALEIVLALAVKTLSNYSNHLFHTEVDEQFAAYKLPVDA